MTDICYKTLQNATIHIILHFSCISLSSEFFLYRNYEYLQLSFFCTIHVFCKFISQMWEIPRGCGDRTTTFPVSVHEKSGGAIINIFKWRKKIYKNNKNSSTNNSWFNMLSAITRYLLAALGNWFVLVKNNQIIIIKDLN